MGVPQNSRNNRQLTSVADAATYHHQSCRKPEERRVGHEWETFLAYPDGGAVDYVGKDGKAGFVDVLKAMHKANTGWQPVTDGANGPLIGLERTVPGGNPRSVVDKEQISAEPGCQLEYASAAPRGLGELGRSLSRFHSELSQALDRLNMVPMGAGWMPTPSEAGQLRVPKTRYQQMFSYMRGEDKAAACDSCSVQATFDYTSEKNAVEIARLTTALMPLATAFANNSPSKYGVISGATQSHRMERWNRYLPDEPEATKRSGNMPWVHEKDFGFDAYVNRMGKLPLMFVVEDGLYRPSNGKTFGDTVRAGDATLSDYANFLTSTTYDIRFKSGIEVRQMDSTQDPKLVMAYTALWTGLLYDDKARNAALELVSPWSQSTRDRLREDVPRHGLSTPIGVTGRTLGDLAKEVLPLAAAGLKRLGESPALLAPLEDMLVHGNRACQLLERAMASNPVQGFNRLAVDTAVLIGHYRIPDARRPQLERCTL